MSAPQYTLEILALAFFVSGAAIGIPGLLGAYKHDDYTHDFLLRAAGAMCVIGVLLYGATQLI